MKKMYLFLALIMMSGFLFAQKSATGGDNSPKISSVNGVNVAPTQVVNFTPSKSVQALALESFEGTVFPPTGWTKQSPDAGTGWAMDTVGTSYMGWTPVTNVIFAAPSGGNHVAYATWMTGGASYDDQWLITPQFAVAAGEGLSFYSVFPMSYKDTLEIYVSTTTNAVSAFTTRIGKIGATSQAAWVQNTISLAAYAGQSIYIGFREYIADNLTNGGWVGLDLVQTVALPTSTDLAVTAIPQNTMTPLEHAMFAFGANIANSGAALTAATNLNITATPGTYSDVVAITVPLAMGANENIYSTNYFTAPALGNYTVTYAAPLTGDPTSVNNTATNTFAVTDSTWATDDNTPVGSIGGTTANFTFGNLYQVIANDFVTTVSVGFGDVAADLAFTISLYTVDAGTGIATNVFTSPSFTRTVAMANLITDFNIVNQAVTPGLYLCAINQATTDNIGVANDAAPVGSIYILQTGNALGLATAYGNVFVRMHNGSIGASIKSVELGKVSVFPNPSTGNLTIVNAPNSNVEVYNLVGELVYSASNVMSNVDLSSLTNGSYIVKVTTKDGVYNEKINIVR